MSVGVLGILGVFLSLCLYQRHTGPYTLWAFGLFLVLSPAMNYVSRSLERSADLAAGAFTGAPEVLSSAISKLAENNLAQKELPRYYELLFSSHPCPSTRRRYLEKLAAAMARLREEDRVGGDAGDD